MKNPDNEPGQPEAEKPSEDLIPGTEPGTREFTPEVLDKSVIAMPLLKEMEQEDQARQKAPGRKKKTAAPAREYDLIIDLNLHYAGGRPDARKRVEEMIRDLKTEPAGDLGLNEVKSRYSTQYVFARLTADMIRELVRADGGRKPGDRSLRAIYRIWPDFEVKAFTTRSIRTVKADAARSSFAALGEGITWAVVDSGIDSSHPHFELHQNINPKLSYHLDLTARTEAAGKPFQDAFGHGTHVAGIIAGEVPAEAAQARKLQALTRYRNEQGEIVHEASPLANGISGMAPRCQLVSLKVLNEQGVGQASSLIAAIEHVQEINGYGRDIKIHGVNMSLGYSFDPEWFACGQSPLCVEVNRLVKSGVVVVAAAGNTGYGYARTAFKDIVATGMPLSINDPGNAELAITVGSTHREMPHTYGVSYFSSKGPTGDGRMKPDLVAPGEKIVSCAAGSKRVPAPGQAAGQADLYVEDSGTSMAAPHVSGVVAAFLSIRREYIGRAEVVKEIFVSTATDLKRDRYFQGHGLIDLMRAIQSV
ncbi:MAG: S8 family peptidase [Adhaeribacter sp.]